MSAALDVLAGLLERAGKKVIRRGNAITFACPLHDDRAPSAGAQPGDRVPVVARCQVCGEGASLPAMLEELGASDADRDLILGGTSRAKSSCREEYANWFANPPGELVHHDYTDADVKPLLRKTRRVVNGKTALKPDRRRDIATQYWCSGAWRWPGDVPALLVQLAALQVALAARLCEPAPEPSENGDELLDVEQAAALLGVDRAWVWRRSRRVDWRPFTVKLSRKAMRLRRRGLERWIARQGSTAR